MTDTTLLWKLFSQLNKIPRQSKKEEQAVKWAQSWAETNRFVYQTDDIGNTIVSIPAKKGYENAPTLTLQAHLDMVCESNNPHFNFETQGIETYIKDGWMYAKETTLGADNGIGVVAAMALATQSQTHGPLNILLTVDEETGLNGAKAVPKEFLETNYLINLDSEDIGEVTIACAGSAQVSGIIPINWTHRIREAHKINILDMPGGHSGVDINDNRGNAIISLAQILSAFNEPYMIAEFEGGTVRNAIPRSSYATIIASNWDIQRAKGNYVQTEKPSLQIEPSQVRRYVSPTNSENIVNAILEIPNEVLEYETNFPDQVKTSSNLGRVELRDSGLYTLSLVRSSNTQSVKDASQQIITALKLRGSQTEYEFGYGGWAPDSSSKLLEIFQDSCRNILGHPYKVVNVHAGLECGVLKNIQPNLEAISFGPTIKNPHSPQEKVNINSVNEFYQVLLHTVENIAKISK